MARFGAPRDRSKEQFWRRLLRLWRGSGRTVRAFCAEHDVNEASFFAWRRTIAQRDQDHPGPLDSSAKHSSRRRPTASQPAFVPLRVIATPARESASAFEVVLNDDRVVRVPAGFDPVSLRQLLAILQEQSPC